MLKMFTKKDTNSSLSSSINDIDQEILDHRLNLIELNNRIKMLQEKKVLLTSYLKNESLAQGCTTKHDINSGTNTDHTNIPVVESPQSELVFNT